MFVISNFGVTLLSISPEELILNTEEQFAKMFLVSCSLMVENTYK